MASTGMKLRAGDWVEVKSPHEIAQTLDAEGTLDGLPFMPEMLDYCGRRFRVLRQAEKTCIEIPAGGYLIREFRKNDVFLLEGLRCNGADHAGCQRQCTLFWKKAWLRKIDLGQSDIGTDQVSRESLCPSLKTMTEPGRYFCQSTELIRAAKSEPMGQIQIVMKCFRDVRSGAVGVLEMIRLISFPVYRKIRDHWSGRPRLIGPLKRTPVGTLGLQPGEIVQIKSLKEMQATLDHSGRNRGLVCDIELEKFCGMKFPAPRARDLSE